VQANQQTVTSSESCHLVESSLFQRTKGSRT